MSRKVKVQPNKETARLPTDLRPYDQPWINSCYQQTLLPNAPWHKLEEEISHNLAQKAEKQFNYPQRREMLMEILGKQFCEKYLTHIQRSPDVLSSSNISAEEKKRLSVDATNWLNSQLYKAVSETGHGYLLSGLGPGEPPPSGNYAEFLSQTFSVFTTGLDRHLYLQEKNLTKSKFDELSRLKKAGKKADIYKVPAPSRIKPVSSADTKTTTSTAKPTTSQVQALVHNLEGDPPPLWGPQSDAIGSAAVSLLQRDPRKFDMVVGRLHGRQLPGRLRAYIWADVLFKGERKKMKEVAVEKVVRERFALAVTRGLTDLRIKKPTQSPINGLIQNAVIETYSKTTSMVAYKEIEHMKETIRALNVLYVYDRSYEPYLIDWLYPLQIAFRSKQAMTDDMGEHVLELAMYLDMLNSSCYPSWPHVFNMAEQVMAIIQDKDPQLHDHLKRIAPINAQVNPKEFLVQLLHQERDHGEALVKAGGNTPRAPSSSTQFLADPTIFLRRWIGEGFVSILDTPAVMYVWDQIFMQQWKQSAIINVCLALLELLRHLFFEAYDYVGMKEVFLMEPCKLYTVDIQMAWIHVETGKNLVDIGELFNRQRPQSAVSRMSSEPLTDRETPVSGFLRPCGIKNIRFELTIPAEAIQKEPWLAKLKPDDLRLNTGIYFGSVKMRSRLSHSLGVLASVKRDSYGGIVVELEYPVERYIYDMLDLSQFDVEKELGAYPYAIFKLECMRSRPASQTSLKSGAFAIGWGRISLYRKASRHGDEEFSLLEGDVTVPLHPGEIPDSFISTHPQTPDRQSLVEGSLIGYSCTVAAHVFDPNNEPPTRQPEVASKTPTPTPPPVSVPPIDTRPSPKLPTPRPDPTPQTPVPPAPPTPKDASDPWVKHIPASTKGDPKPTTNRDPFMLYIDAVRYIPDNASIIKVTGRILRAGDVTDLRDIMALPDLDSSARSPAFSFSMLVNEGRRVASPDLLLFIRIYTINVISEKLEVIGSALVNVFTPGKRKGEAFLRVGGHQVRVRSGMPDTKSGLGQIGATDLDKNPQVPGCSLLLRLLPQSQTRVPAPAYSSGYYKSDACKPNLSETRVFSSYSETLNYPTQERDMIRRLQESERSNALGRSDGQLNEWMVNRLDIKKQLAVNVPANNLPLWSCVRYRVKTGLQVQFVSAKGLPEGMSIQCVGRLAVGQQARFMTATDSYGKDESFFTSKLQPTSSLTAPTWDHTAKEVHPYYDSNTCLLIEIIGLKVVYRPRADHKTPGTIHKSDGSDLDITDQDIIGWTIVPLFKDNAVISGKHTVPILTLPLSEEITDELSQSTPSAVLNKRIWNEHTKLPNASLEVFVWDGHFEYNELPEPQNFTSLLDSVGETSQSTLPTQPAGPTQQEALLAMLEERVRKQGLKGITFKKEFQFFQEVSNRAFTNMLDKYMLRKGYTQI